nr:ATP-binding protein [Burkholderiaceae bacterium]HQR69849.1 ATP-binding protein [Burkholderiaceae bacterium]
MTSIRRWLLAALLAALAVAGLASAAATYISARDEVDTLLDEELRQVALSLRDHAVLDLRRLESVSANPAQRVLVQIWDPAFDRPYVSRLVGASPMPRTDEGYTTLLHDGRSWRVFTLFTGRQLIQVAQPTALRTELAARTAWRLLAPVLLLLPVLGLVGWWIVGRGLAPLGRIAGAVKERSPTALTPVSTSGLPVEIRPLADALNDLLGRLDHSFSLQRRFAADAAHELRTPLTALSLQLQLAERAQTGEDRARAFERLRQGIRRATRLVQQLLTMARLDPDAATATPAIIDVAALVASVVEDARPLAAGRSIALDCTAASSSTAVVGSDDALRILFNNLVDNAIRYTPEGGRVTVRVSRDGGEVQVDVDDTGPGIPEEERERVFDRFYRGRDAGATGTGLGLAIVSQVAEMHRGTVTLGAADSGGLRVRVRLPASAGDAGERTAGAGHAS